MKYIHDASRKLKEVHGPKDEVTRYGYDPMGMLQERILPNGMVSSYDIDPLGRISSLTHQSGDEILDKYVYQYDAADNTTQILKQRAGIEADTGKFNYGYDALGRLVSLLAKRAILGNIATTALAIAYRCRAAVG